MGGVSRIGERGVTHVWNEGGKGGVPCALIENVLMMDVLQIVSLFFAILHGY